MATLPDGELKELKKARGKGALFPRPRGKKSTVTHPDTTRIGPIPAILSSNMRFWPGPECATELHQACKAGDGSEVQNLFEGLSEIRVPWCT